MIQVLVGAAAIAGFGYWMYSEGEKQRKKRQERTEKEKSLWNDGKCPHCGGKWHVRYYYPGGSRGEYQYAAITCHRCKKKATLMHYKPVMTTDYEYIDLENKS